MNRKVLAALTLAFALVSGVAIGQALDPDTEWDALQADLNAAFASNNEVRSRLEGIAARASALRAFYESTTTTSTTTTTTQPPTTTTTQPPTTTTTTTPPPSCQGVQVAAGANLVNVAGTNAAGATFCLAAGTYNVGAAIPMQSGDKWIGALGANNARLSILTGNDSTVELNVGNVSGVTVKNFIIERFNPPNEGGRGAVRAANDWLIENNEIRSNPNNGIYHAQRAVIRGNFIHDNSGAGINGFQASDSLIEDNQIFNNGSAEISGVSSGAKWVGGQRVTIRDNHFLGNRNNGLWVDTNIVDFTITGNLVETTTHSTTDGKGLHIEDTCSVVATGNEIRNNEDNVYLVANRVLDFSDNIITTPGDEAIRVWQEDGGTFSCHQTIFDNNILDNTVSGGRVRVIEAQVVNGSIFAAGDERLFFDGNNYSGTTFEWDGSLRTFAQWQALGNDLTGSMS